MNLHPKTCVAALSLLFFTQSSCKKIDPSKDKSTDPPANEGKLFLPVKLEAGKRQILLKYTDKTALLLSVEESNGYKEVFSYDKRNRISGLEIYEKEQLIRSSDYFYDAEGRINSINQFKITGPVYTPTGHQILNRQPDGKISKVTGFDIQDKVIQYTTYAYDTGGKLSNMTIEGPSLKKESISFSYDQKPGICTSVQNASLLFLESRFSFLFCSSVCNLINKTAAGTDKALSYSYEYDKNNYPSKMVLKEGSLSSVFTLTYKTLPLITD